MTGGAGFGPRPRGLRLRLRLRPRPLYLGLRARRLHPWLRSLHPRLRSLRPRLAPLDFGFCAFDLRLDAFDLGLGRVQPSAPRARPSARAVRPSAPRARSSARRGLSWAPLGRSWAPPDLFWALPDSVLGSKRSVLGAPSSAFGSRCSPLVSPGTTFSPFGVFRSAGPPGVGRRVSPLAGCSARSLIGPPAALAGATDGPLNTPALEVAATGGLPLLAVTNADSLRLAALVLCRCAVVGGTCVLFGRGQFRGGRGGLHAIGAAVEAGALNDPRRRSLVDVFDMDPAEIIDGAVVVEAIAIPAAALEA